MSKCKHKKLALVFTHIHELEPDQEPFEEGVLEEMDTITVGIILSGHWCPQCDKLIDIRIEEQ